MFRLKQFLIGLMVILAVSSSVYAQEATSNRINGVAEFLLERAKDNFLYLLQQNMEANQLLKCYLPETYKYATSSNLQLLLQSGPELWKGSVEADLKNFGIQLIFKELSPDTLKKWASNIDDQYIEALHKINIKFKGKDYPVTELPIDASQELRDAVNSFYDDYLQARSKIDTIISDIEGARSSSSRECPTTAYGSIGSVLQNVVEAVDSLKTKMSRFDNTDVVWKESGDTRVSIGLEFYKSIVSPLVEVDERLKYYSSQIDAIRSEAGLVVQMFKLDRLIRDSIESGENPLISASDMKEYNRFSLYALSFAILSEAKSTDQVKSVMQQLTLPPVSFGVKRESNARKFMITAYFGAQGGVEDTTADSSRGFGGLTVPVGFEYSYGLNIGSVSLMLAPLDFAHPVNQIINESEGSADFKDIFNPGLYISYDLKKLPVVVGVGCSRGPSITEVQEGNNVRYFLFMGLDMPLFNLY